MAASYINKNISSKVGLIGVIKKMLYFVVVVVAMLVSYIINIDVTTYCVLWLIINETISIFENLVKCGVPLPGKLEKIINSLKIKNNKE